MGQDARVERRRVRAFFAGLLVVAAVLDIVGALLEQHQTRSQVLETLLPASITLGGRTGVVLSGLSLLLLAGGIARGKRVAFRLTLLVLVATIAFELVKDLDFEAAALFAWILLGLWWFRHHFEADSDPAHMRWGFAVLVAGVLLAVLYATAGSFILGRQLRPEPGFVGTLETLLFALIGNPSTYRALTDRASWFLGSLPVVSYALVLVALTQLLRPVLAPRAVASERERLERLLEVWGRNRISHLAIHGASSYYWLNGDGCVAFTLRGRTALALGDPIAAPDKVDKGAAEFVAYCDRQDWIPAFYQIDDPAPYRNLGMAPVPIGSEALLKPGDFSLAGKKRADLRYAVHRCEREGVQFSFGKAPEVMPAYAEQLQAVSGAWLDSRHSPELGYSLGTLGTLSDPRIVVGLAFAAGGRVDAFVSWLPVPARNGWTLDLMRRRPDSAYGVIEALIVKSIEEAQRRGIAELSLGVAPRVISSGETHRPVDRALEAMYWGLDRFQRSRTLYRFKEKFGPCWEDRYLSVPSTSTLPEVMVALVRAHMPLSRSLRWISSMLSSSVRPHRGRRALA